MGQVLLNHWLQWHNMYVIQEVGSNDSCSHGERIVYFAIEKEAGTVAWRSVV
jgi:hypothetical protein